MKRQSLRVVLPFALLAAGLGALALLVATRPRHEARPPEPHPPLVHIARVERGPYRFFVHAQGTVVPRTASELVPQVGGEVTWVSPSLVAGGFFDDDEPLLRIDPVDAEAQLEAARAAVARAESEASRASKEFARQRVLAKSAVASEARIDDAENAAHVAEATLREARARLRRATRDLERTEIRAPYAGRVRSKSVDVGQVVTPGVPIASLYAVDWAEVRLPVPDRELLYLDIPLAYQSPPPSSETNHAAAAPEDADGPPAWPETAGERHGVPSVRLHAEFAGAEREWNGRIVRTEGEIDPHSRMVTLVARVEDPYGRIDATEGPPLAVGLFVQAEIEGREVADATVLPRTALRDDDRVLVLGPDDRLAFRSVEVLRAEREQVVIGAGLEPGERVLISPLPSAIEGMLVHAIEEPTSAEQVASEAVRQ